MALIDRTGTFRGIPLDTGIATTKNGYPQFVVQLKAVEYFDDEEREWVDWSEVEENSIMAYLVLFGSDGTATLTAKQIQKAFGWSGESFAELNNTDYSDQSIQFRVEQHTYEGNTSLQVNWIDVADAVPGKTIQKADEKEIQKLDAEYGKGLRKLSGGKTVKPKKADTEKPIAPEKKPAPPKAKKETGKTSKKKKRCTKEEAWNAANEAKAESISDDQLSEIWLQTIEDLGDEDSFKQEDWYRVREIVKTKVEDDIPF